jgi:predicted nucleic acid-binding protein
VIVVDTAVIAYLLIAGDRSEAADRLWQADPEWIAPRLWLDEFLNVLATTERHGWLDSRLAAGLLDDAVDLLLDGTFEVRSERVLAVARRTGCSGYDSQYIALAEDLGVPLYTWDRQILSRCPQLAIAPP